MRIDKHKKTTQNFFLQFPYKEFLAYIIFSALNEKIPNKLLFPMAYLLDWFMAIQLPLYKFCSNLDTYDYLENNLNYDDPYDYIDTVFFTNQLRYT